jgi:hypothetical protein
MELNNSNEREKSKKLLPLYYKEGERIIFTEQFHIERGSCCGNGCRHCPYEPKHVKGNMSLSKKYH